MNILGFNPSHHGSVCLLQDGKIKYFIQEERIGNRKKYSSYPFRSFIDILENYKIDIIAWGAPTIEYPLSDRNPHYPYWLELTQSYNPKAFHYNFSKTQHHQVHAFHAFYNSGFNKALSIVVDGKGSGQYEKDKFIGQETESIFVCKYPANVFEIFKNIDRSTSTDIVDVNLSQIYETITMHLGWNRNEAGKTMGLSPYGGPNKSIPNFFKEYDGYLHGDRDIFYISEDEVRGDNYNHTFINEKNNPSFKLKNSPKEWHHNKSKITKFEKDLAWKVQNDTQEIVGNYIEKAIEVSGLKQVCCSGGYFLNVITNYYLIKRFPDIKFYFEPIANDAGTAIGAAQLAWYLETKSTTPHNFKSLYLGKQYSKNEIMAGIKKYM